MTDRVCTLDGCDRPHAARGLCKTHWNRAKANGTLDQHRLGATRVGDIVSQTAAEHGCTVPELLGRDRRHATARVDAAHRLRPLGLSTSEIGRMLGARDHTTVLHYLSKPRPDVPARPRPDLEVCQVDGCGRDHKTMGLCVGHYMRWKRDGDIRADVPLRRMKIGPTLDLDVHDRQGYRAGCRCDVCRADATRHVKRSRHRPLRVDASHGVRALEAAKARGWSVPKIADAVGVGSAGLYAWLDGRTARVLEATVDAINALGQADTPTCEDCDAEPMAGGRWCWPCYRSHANPRPLRATGCGTDAGYTAHRRAGTDPCGPCRAAHVEAQHRRKGAA